MNGVEVGFSTDSKLPAHFDIAALVRPGSNHLAVRVYRWDTSSYLEKQDYWHLSGIQRSVRLVAKPAVHLRDWAHQVRFHAAFRDAHARRPGLDRAAARTLGADRFRHGPLAGGAPLDGCVPPARKRERDGGRSRGRAGRSLVPHPGWELKHVQLDPQRASVASAARPLRLW